MKNSIHLIIAHLHMQMSYLTFLYNFVKTEPFVEIQVVICQKLLEKNFQSIELG